jgi:PAS domain S-box-containing protein
MTGPAAIRVLLVEDNPTDALLVRDELDHVAGETFSVHHVDHLKQALESVGLLAFDVVLLDLSLPDSHGFETFVRLRDAAVGVPIVVLSGHADGKIALQAVQAGAQDYLVKGRLGENALPRAIRYAIERQRAERTLAESEERYRWLIERSPDAYLVLCEEQIVFANASSLRLFGADSLAHLQGRAFGELIAPEFQAAMGQRSLRGEGRPVEFEGRRMDGSAVAVEGTSHPFMHAGKPALQIVLHDISERKESEQRFDWLVNSNAQGVMFWNTKGEITGGNDAFLALVGYPREDLELGLLNWSKLTPPEYAELDRRALEEMRAQGFCTPYEKDFMRKDGSRVSLLMVASASPVNPEEGVCFTHDLTERNKLQQHSLRTQRMESIGTLAGGIAHDLNNSLGPIITALSLLQEQFTDPDSQELISIISSSAHRGADMVRQVLSFARGVEGRRMEVQINHLLREVSKIARDTSGRWWAIPRNCTRSC